MQSVSKHMGSSDIKGWLLRAVIATWSKDLMAVRAASCFASVAIMPGIATGAYVDRKDVMARASLMAKGGAGWSVPT